MLLHRTCPVLTPIIYNEINFGVHTSYLSFVDGKGAIVVNVFTAYWIQRDDPANTRRSPKAV